MRLNLKRFKGVQIDLEAYLAKLKSRGLGPDGRQVPDPTPLAPPIGYKKQPSMVEIVREMVRSERLKQEAEASGHESFEDSEDFDVGDDPDLLHSPWENDFDPPLNELIKAGREALAKKKAPEANVRGVEGGDPPPPVPPKDEPKGS